jgi:hypothetical protein
MPSDIVNRNKERVEIRDSRMQRRLRDEAELLLCPHKDSEEEVLRKMILIGDTAEGS